MNIYHENQVPWPHGKPRAQSRKNGPFRTSMADAPGRIERELYAFTRVGHEYRVTDCTIFADWAVGHRKRFIVNGRCEDPGVVVTFVLDGKEFQLCADAYNSPEQNLAGIAEYIKAIRAQERNGIFTVDEMLGFAQLPAPNTYFVGCDTPQKVEARYRELAREHHPDKGGDPAIMAEINRQREALK